MSKSKWRIKKVRPVENDQALEFDLNIKDNEKYLSICFLNRGIKIGKWIEKEY
ncbi:hypothetical protein [Halalkalibacter oceani]|uniref:hypothetical protein n=1 Tax=Halalkalibacter oceani TaxID=1653776 RepID=UPI003398F806